MTDTDTLREQISQAVRLTPYQRGRISREAGQVAQSVVRRRMQVDNVLAVVQPAIREVRRDAAREVGLYIEHLHPNGPTHTTAVLADIDLAADRMGRGLHANGRERETP